MPFEQPSLEASEAMDRFRFIAISGAYQAGYPSANAATFGVTTGGSQDLPQDSSNTFAAKAAGDAFEYRSPGDVTLLQCAGGAGWNAGDFLASNATGCGVVVANTNFIGAQAIEDTAANEVGEVMVMQSYKYFSA